MERNARIRFTPRHRAELWERWKSGQGVSPPHFDKNCTDHTFGKIATRNWGTTYIF
jgi:hypothetical protein